MPKMQERAVESAAQAKDKMKPKPHTVKLLRRICAEILKEPRRFNMSHFIGPQSNSPCGTSACIAGFATAIERSGANPVTKETLRKLRGRPIDFEAEGWQALGITMHQKVRLFYTEAWPRPFDRDFELAEGPGQRAKVAVARIKHFINTGK